MHWMYVPMPIHTYAHSICIKILKSHHSVLPMDGKVGAITSGVALNRLERFGQPWNVDL